MKWRWINIQKVDDKKDGSLSIVEVGKRLFKRFFWVSDVSKAAVRGMHAHRKQSQAIFCLSGTFELELNDGMKSEKILMTKTRGVFIEPCVWTIMKKFSQRCLVLVLCSDHYDESEYIRDFREFRKLCK